MPNPNPLQEALDITNNARRESYGHPAVNFQDIAKGWTAILRKKNLGIEVTAEQVALMMIWLKVCREAHASSPDNLVDIAGYTNTLFMIQEYRDEASKTEVVAR